MLWLLAAVGLLAQETVADLLARLGAAGIDEREEAQQQLIGRGVAVLGELEVAEKAASDREIRARLGIVIARLRELDEGALLYAEAIEGKAHRLVLVTVDGVVRELIGLGRSGAWSAAPTWSPDGSRIAFIGEIDDPHGQLRNTDPRQELRIIDANGKNLRGVSKAFYGTARRAGRWSANGEHIVVAGWFTSGDAWGRTSYRLSLVDVTKRDTRTLADWLPRCSICSHDGVKTLFVSAEDRDPDKLNDDRWRESLYECAVDGSGAKERMRLPKGVTEDVQQRADGAISYLHEGKVFVLPPGAREAHAIDCGVKQVSAHAWTADVATLAFQDGETGEVSIVPVKGGKPRKLRAIEKGARTDVFISGIGEMAFSRKGGYVAVLGPGGRIHIINVGTGAVRSVTGPAIGGINWSPGPALP